MYFRGCHRTCCAKVDSDFAGDRTSRTSRSGGCVVFGKHLLNLWASNQAVTALFSGETERHGLLKGYSCSLVSQSMWEDFGAEVWIVVGTDSSAAKSLCERRGLLTAKHFHASLLWCQDSLCRKKCLSLSRYRAQKIAQMFLRRRWLKMFETRC